jgi:hypothetical protein
MILEGFLVYPEEVKGTAEGPILDGLKGFKHRVDNLVDYVKITGNYAISSVYYT